MLPKYFKFVIENVGDNTIEFSTDGANNTFTITGYGVKWNSGALSYGETDETLFADPSTDLASGAALASSEIDNSSNLYIGYWCLAEIASDANDSDGQLDIYWQWASSSASASDYPTDASQVIEAEDCVYITSVGIGTGASVDRHASFFLTAPMG